MGQRPPDLAAVGFVRLPRSSADRNDRRPRLLTERCPPDVGANEDECARGCVHPLAVELERRAPALDEIKLLLQVMLLRLVVLVDEPIAHLMSCKCIDAERRDAEVEPDGPRGDAAVIDLVDLVNPRYRVTAQSAVLAGRVGTPLGRSLTSAPARIGRPRRGDIVDGRLRQRAAMTPEHRRRQATSAPRSIRSEKELRLL